MTNDQLCAEYIEGKSLAQCSRDYNLATNEIKRILAKNNIHIRSRAEQTVFTNQQRGLAINHMYFHELNPENCYYIGFLAADGSISKSGNQCSIKLSAVDASWLEEFKSKLESSHKIGNYTTSNGYDVASFKFTSRQIKNDLAKYSVVPNKTYQGVTMKNIPTDELKWCFVKGFFDGDGSFSWSEKTKQGTLKICSYTKDILEEIQDLIHRTYPKINSNIYTLVRQNNTVINSLEYSTIPSQMILEYFYSLSTPCLARKYQHFIDFKNYRIETLNPRAKTALQNRVEDICSSGPELTGSTILEQLPIKHL